MPVIENRRCLTCCCRRILVAIAELLPTLLETAITFFSSIKYALNPTPGRRSLTSLDDHCEYLIENPPLIIEAAMVLIIHVQGIGQALPTLNRQRLKQS